LDHWWVNWASTLIVDGGWRRGGLLCGWGEGKQRRAKSCV
jgi:hypothetical protein